MITNANRDSGSAMNGTPLRLTFLVLLVVVVAAFAETGPSDLAAEVDAVERAFARSMAERDFAAFESFLSDEAVFLGGGGANRGKQAVAEHWKRYFEGEEAPFSWEPATVEVLDSGTLAISTGPVYNGAGERVSTYTSIWRLEEPGTWRIVFDKGDKFCE